MIIKELLLYILVIATATSACSKKDNNNAPDDPGDPTNGTVDFKPTTTLVAGSVTEFGSTTNTTPLNARFSGITKLVLDNRDNKTAFYVIDQSDADLRIIDDKGVRTVSNVVGVYGLAQGICLAPGGAGKVYITSGYGQLVELDVNRAYDWGTNPRVIIDRNAPNGNITGVGGTHGLVADANGNIYLGNSYYNTVTQYNPATKTIVPFAGKPLKEMTEEVPPFADGNATTKAVFGNVADVAITQGGKMYVADRLYRTIREVENGNVRALFSPSPYPYENYIQPSVDGTLDKAKSGMIRYVAVPAGDKNRVFFTTSGTLRLILLNENRVISLATFSEGIYGIAPTADGKTVYVVKGHGIVKVELGK